jgi:transposase-like protein
MQSGEMPVAQISWEYQVTRSLLYYWWQQYRERGEAAFAPTKEGLVSPSVSRPQTPDEQVARLERLCGQQALEIDRLQAESFFKTVKYEEVYLHRYQTLSESLSPSSAITGRRAPRYCPKLQESGNCSIIVRASMSKPSHCTEKS